MTHDSADRTSTGTGRQATPANVFEAFYNELHRLAGHYFHGERTGHTLQPTALVSEAFLRIANASQVFNDTVHVKAVAAMAMRQVLVDHARKRGAKKRGGSAKHITLNEAITPDQSSDVDILWLDDVLDRLASHSERQARIVELRFFAGLTIEQTAEVLGVSHATVSSDWRFARAWIRNELGKET